MKENSSFWKPYAPNLAMNKSSSLCQRPLISPWTWHKQNLLCQGCFSVFQAYWLNNVGAMILSESCKLSQCCFDNLSFMKLSLWVHIILSISELAKFIAVIVGKVLFKTIISSTLVSLTVCLITFTEFSEWKF